MDTLINERPRTFENVDGILGHAYSPTINLPASVGKYRQFIFRSKPTGISEPIGTDNKKFSGVTVYPHYELSINLNIANQSFSSCPDEGWSNVLAFHQNGVKGFDTSVPGNIPIGARIPAVFVYSEHQGPWSRYQLNLVQTGIGRPCASNFFSTPKSNHHNFFCSNI